MIILDTNVISEQTKPHPSASVLRWATSHRSGELYTTTITEAEMLVGIEIMPEGCKRLALSDQISRIFSEDFADRVLPFDRAAAHALGPIVAARQKAGRLGKMADMLIAAIARSHSATIATRDVEGFEGCGVTIVNPWSADSRK